MRSGVFPQTQEPITHRFTYNLSNILEIILNDDLNV